MRQTSTARVGAALAAAAVLALAGCSDDKPTAAPTTTPPVTTPATTTPASTTPSVLDTPTWPPGCASPAALPAGATVIEATVSGGKVSPPRATHDVKLNSAVRILVTADVADEVHLHSYDKHADTTPGCPAVLDFTANIPGTVEVELEDAGLHLFDVRAK